MPKSKAINPYREIALRLIDPPTHAMRETFDEDGLKDLAASIAAIGVVQPIKVIATGDRFQIVAGHRRYIASVMAEKETIPCLVTDCDAGAMEAMKVAENLFREDVNPADEAGYLNFLLGEHCGGDVDVLCAMTKLKRGYVEDRLLLLEGDPEILAAVRDKVIGFGVARELQRVRDRGHRLAFLDAAIKGGATVRMVRQWRDQANVSAPVEPMPAGDGANQYSGAAPPTFSMRCVVCEQDNNPEMLDLIYVHRIQCIRILHRALGIEEPAPAGGA